MLQTQSQMSWAVLSTLSHSLLAYVPGLTSLGYQIKPSKCVLRGTPAYNSPEAKLR